MTRLERALQWLEFLRALFDRLERFVFWYYDLNMADLGNQDRILLMT